MSLVLTATPSKGQMAAASRLLRAIGVPVPGNQSSAWDTAIKVSLGQRMYSGEQYYYQTFGCMPDEHNDPDGRLDRRARQIATAVSDGFDERVARLSGQEFLSVRVGGSVTLTDNPEYGIVSSYRQSISRREHGLPPNASNRQGGRKRRTTLRKQSTEYSRLFWET